jgi:8-oxo-dGTP pyrophosphatase MutT (NUDIX family)
MQLLTTLTEMDFNPGNTITPESEYISPRRATRIVIFDDQNNVALGCVTPENGNTRYSMIGGGIDEGESIEQAFKREALEEAGCAIKNIKELGIIEERGVGNETRGRFTQTNYCFTANVDGEKMEPQFTEEDARDGLGLVWLPIDVAISKLKDQPDGFITRKTLILLEEAERIRMV